MSEASAEPRGSGPTTMYCTQCGQAMRVALEHMHVRVGCPHCREILEPWRVKAAAAPPQEPLAPPEPEPPRPAPQPYEPLRPEPPGAAPSPPTVCGGSPPPDWTGYSWRNRWVAGALGVLLGPWGVHRFYLGYVGIGVLQIVVTILTVGFGGLWGFIEGVLCLVGAWPAHDADGLPLRS